MRLRAIHDFNPIQMKYGERNELENILMTRRLVDFSYSETLSFKTEDEMQIIFPYKIETEDEMTKKIDYTVKWWKVKHLKSGKIGFIPEGRVFVISKAKGNLVAIRDFEPEDMRYSERIELEKVVKSRRHVEFMRAEKKRESKEYNISEEAPVNGDGSELREELTNDLMGQNIQQYKELSGKPKLTEHVDVDEKQNNLQAVDEFDQERKHEQSTSTDFEDSYNSEVEARTLTFKRGDTMETIPPANVGDSTEWWKARHLNTEKIGFILRNQVVIENDQQTSKTMLSELPLELLDIILQYSIIHWTASCSLHQRQVDALKCLASVDFCWFQRIEKQRFKNKIQRRLRDFNRKATRRSAVIRQNRIYLLENLDPSEEFLDSLLSLNCITEEESQYLKQLRSIGRKNGKLLLYLLSNFNQTKFSHFVSCLRRANQKTVARIVENGGVVVKVELQNRGGNGTTSVETQLLHHRISDLWNKTKPRLHQTDILISQLKDKGIEILNCQLDKQTAVVWIWCHSQTAIEYIQKLYESNKLTDILSGIANIRRSASEVNQSIEIKIKRNLFKKRVVECPISIRLTERINVGRNESVRGVTKLRNEIYVLHGQYFYTTPPPGICVYEDRHPFRLQRKIKIEEILNPTNIGSSEKENCLFVHDIYDRNVWKITREMDGQHKIVKLLKDDYKSVIMSASSDGRLLLFCHTEFSLKIYGSEAKVLRSISLPTDISCIQHAVETSVGNFIVLHDSSVRKSKEEKEAKEHLVKNREKKVGELGSDGQWHILGPEDMEGKDEFEPMKGKILMKGKKEEEEEEKEEEKEEEEEESGSRGRESIEKEKEAKEERERGPNETTKEVVWCISELNSNGDVIRRFVSSNEKQKLENPMKLSLDSDDQVFVTDRASDRVILFDSDLKWNRIICLTKEEDNEEEEEGRAFMPQTLCYDDEKKQLIVGGYGGLVNIYTFSQT